MHQISYVLRTARWGKHIYNKSYAGQLTSCSKFSPVSSMTLALAISSTARKHRTLNKICILIGCIRLYLLLRSILLLYDFIIFNFLFLLIIFVTLKIVVIAAGAGCNYTHDGNKK